MAANSLVEMSQIVKRRRPEVGTHVINYQLYEGSPYKYLFQNVAGRDVFTTVVPYDKESDAQVAYDIFPPAYSFYHDGRIMMVYGELLCDCHDAATTLSNYWSSIIDSKPDEQAKADARVQAGNAIVDYCGRVTELLRGSVMTRKPFADFTDS